MTSSPTSTDVVGWLGDRVRTALREALPEVRRVALLDFPNHINIGDAAIWAGEVAALEACGMRVVYACDQRSYVPDHLRRVLGPDDAILLHGGGNFGDLYSRHQRLRERVLADFPSQLTVQLPQSIAQASEETVARMRVLVRRHERLQLIARDTVTRDRFSSWFDVEVGLAPDSAFALGSTRPDVRRAGILWLARGDDEAAGPRPQSPPGVRRLDWPGAESAWARRRLASRLASYATSRYPISGALTWRAVTPLYPRLAGERVRTGSRIIRSAEVVVTDRLHAHILSLLCGVPVVMSDNSTGKLRAFYDTWTHRSPDVHWAEDPREALQMAKALVDA